MLLKVPLSLAVSSLRPHPRRTSSSQVRLAENMRRQRHAFAQAEARKSEAAKRLTSIRQSQAQGQSAQGMLEQLEGEVRPARGRP